VFVRLLLLVQTLFSMRIGMAMWSGVLADQGAQAEIVEQLILALAQVQVTSVPRPLFAR